MNKVKPVRRMRLPAYPTRLQVLAEPDLLMRHQPPAWRSGAELASAVVVFLAVNGAIKAGDQAQPLTSDAAAVVAPIFAHGEGRGVNGCVVIAPPVFLSEEEALQVIGEELRKAGVDLSEKKVVLPGVTVVPRRTRYVSTLNKMVEEAADEAKATPLKVDRQDPKRKVAVEFVSEDEYVKLGGAASGSSVQQYKFKEVAQRLADRVKKQGKGIYFGAFYEPGNKIRQEEMKTSGDRGFTREQWQVLRDTKAAESKAKLRVQVQDFIGWLKGQGAI